MENEKEVVSKNFIEMEIDKDLAEGVYDTVCTHPVKLWSGKKIQWRISHAF